MREKLLRRKELRRLLSCMLALAMVITLMPLSGLTVYAESTPTYTYDSSTNTFNINVDVPTSITVGSSVQIMFATTTNSNENIDFVSVGYAYAVDEATQHSASYDGKNWVACQSGSFEEGKTYAYFIEIALNSNTILNPTVNINNKAFPSPVKFSDTEYIQFINIGTLNDDGSLTGGSLSSSTLKEYSNITYVRINEDGTAQIYDQSSGETGFEKGDVAILSASITCMNSNSSQSLTITKPDGSTVTVDSNDSTSITLDSSKKYKITWTATTLTFTEFFKPTDKVQDITDITDITFTNNHDGTITLGNLLQFADSDTYSGRQVTADQLSWGYSLAAMSTDKIATLLLKDNYTYLHSGDGAYWNSLTKITGENKRIDFSNSIGIWDEDTNALPYLIIAVYTPNLEVNGRFQYFGFGVSQLPTKVIYNLNGGNAGNGFTDTDWIISGEEWLTNNEVVNHSISPTKEGYTFDGWYTAAEGGYKVTSTNEADAAATINPNSYIGTRSVDLYAHWTQNSSSATSGNQDNDSSTPTESLTIPVRGDDTVQVNATITNGNARVNEITADTLDAVIASGTGETDTATDTITIDVSAAKQEVTGVTLSKTTVETLAKTVEDTSNQFDSVQIKLSAASVEFDGKALSAITDQAKGDQIRLVVENTKTNTLNTAQQESLKEMTVASAFEAYIECNGSRIHDFNGGNATVNVAFTPETGRSATHYHIYYLADTGEKTRYKTRFSDNGFGFTATHFSDYVIVYDETMANETDQVSEEEKAANKLTLQSAFAVSQTGKKIQAKWGRVAGADGYKVYVTYCGDKFTKSNVITVKGADVTSVVVTKINGKALNLTKNYKLYVVAYKNKTDGTGRVSLGNTFIAHIAGSRNKTAANAKAISLTKSAYTLKTGKTARIKATTLLVDPAKKQLSDVHAKEFRYASSDASVATVSASGKITAVGAGTATIYVYARNGYAKKVTVTVAE